MKARIILPLVLLAGAAPAAEKAVPLPPLAAPRASIDGLPIGEIPKQALPAKGCAAFLWGAAGSRALVAMATADPAQLRLSLAGTVTDLSRSAQQGPGGFGFSGVNEYRGGAVTAVLDMTITTRNDLKDGAAVSQATLRVDREGQDSVVLPVVGLIGCA
jgi:hypothetical protein